MTTITAVELDCTGEIGLGALAPETVERLEHLGGEWLELSAERQALVVCHIQPGGTPTLSAVPAELIAFVDALTPEERESMPGGMLVIRDRTGIVVRLVVERGEIHVQWPREDWSHAEPVDLDAALAETHSASARISGHLSLRAPQGSGDRLVDLVGRFEGLYPEGDLGVERDGDTLRLDLRDVNVGPRQLLKTLNELADPIESLEGELEVGSFVDHALDRDFRLTLRQGKVRATRPSLWPAPLEPPSSPSSR